MIPKMLEKKTISVKLLSILIQEKNRWLILIVFTLLAFTIRLYFFSTLMEKPGDGPTKAMYAYNWSQSPHLKWHGIWLPGFEYLTGIFCFIINDPLVSIRVLNLIVGTFTLPLFYLLVNRIYGHISGIIVLFLLAFLPVHVSLSVTSHTETTFLFEVIAGFYLLIKGIDRNSIINIYIITSVFLICLACMTRYEAWLLIPFYSVYYFQKTKNWKGFLSIIIILFFLPLVWSIGNYFNSGKLFLGFSASIDQEWAMGGNSLIIAIKNVGRHTVQQLEWTLVIMASWGIIMNIVHIAKKNSSPEKKYYLFITLFYWLMILRFAMLRGDTLQTRNLLFCVVMLLPFIATPVINYFKSDDRIFSVLLCFIAIAFLIPKVTVFYPLNDLTAKRPMEIKKLALWLEHSKYRNEPVLMTWIGEESSYLPLYFPDIGPHDYGHFILRRAVPNYRLEKYLKSRRPSLLITCDADKKFISQIEGVLRKKLDLSHPVYSENLIKVYDIKYIY